MYYIDYHIHTKYSFDGLEEIDDICEKAIERGMREIALTDHMDIFSDKEYGHILDCENLYKDINRAKEKYKEKLIVRAGVELGQPQANPEASAKFLRDYGKSLDYVIGSIHNMKDDIDVYYYDFSKLDCYQVYDEYLDWLIEMGKNYDFDVMGHLTYPMRYAFEREKVRIEIKPFEEKFRELFRILVERGKGIEINTSGLFQAIKETMPPLELLKLYRECKGEIITVGSDAHKLTQVSLTIKDGYDILENAGFKYVTTFNNRKPEFIKIN